MKTMIAITIAIFTVAMTIAFWPHKATCSMCNYNQQCWNDFQCGPSCQCEKGAGDLKGICVPQ